MQDYMSASTCRYCLLDSLEYGDMFISPCACKGSMKFVHYTCLKTWRNMIPDENFKNRCQICNTEYVLPRRWELETIPNLGKFWNHILSNLFVMVPLVHYIYFNILALFMPIDLLLNPQYMAYVMHSETGILAYNLLLISVTILYATYIIPLFRQIRNPLPYLYYGWASHLLQIFGIVICLTLTQRSIFPFGGLYILFVERYMHIHVKILETVNLNGVL